MHLSVAGVAYPGFRSLAPTPKCVFFWWRAPSPIIWEQLCRSGGTRTSKLGWQISVFLLRSYFEPGPGSIQIRGPSENLALNELRCLGENALHIAAKTSWQARRCASSFRSPLSIATPFAIASASRHLFLQSPKR